MTSSPLTMDGERLPNQRMRSCVTDLIRPGFAPELPCRLRHVDWRGPCQRDYLRQR